MSKTLLKAIGVYLPDDEIEALNELRGPIPISKLGVIALRRLREDIEKGNFDLLSPDARALADVEQQHELTTVIAATGEGKESEI